MKYSGKLKLAMIDLFNDIYDSAGRRSKIFWFSALFNNSIL